MGLSSARTVSVCALPVQSLYSTASHAALEDEDAAAAAVAGEAAATHCLLAVGSGPSARDAG